MRGAIVLTVLAAAAHAQEAPSGFALRSVLTLETLGNSDRDEAAFRMMLYPVWKLNSHWTVAGTVQLRSRPFFFEDLNMGGHGIRGDLLQLHLSYSVRWRSTSLAVRAGELSTAFGSFLLRYDDLSNWLADMPPAYGYYYKPVSTLGLTGIEVNVTAGRLDARAQLTSSSPANRRSPFDSDQYANWAGGAGYTFRHGLRAGASAYRGPYLYRTFRYYFPGEANPRDLPATGLGADAQWGRGPWNVNGEWQRFIMAYRAIPTFRSSIAYAEARRTLGPRWYIAARASRLRYSASPDLNIYEGAIGFRPAAAQLIKFAYQANTFALQYVVGLP
jgi:hypothetical protein